MARMGLLSFLPAVQTLTQQLADAKAQVRTVRDELKAAQDAVKRLDKHARTPVLDPHALKAVLKGDGRHYQSAEPFPHIVIDNFLSPAILQRVAVEFSGMDRTGWNRTNNADEKKLSSTDDTRFGPFTNKVIHALNSSTFLTFLERLTGIAGIIADLHLRGGGLHEIERGGKLGVHADFNFDERLKIYRRLNLLIYLNQTWQESWGGQLELWSKDGTQPVRSVLPTFNRAVIFDTSNKSYHGHPHPLACPEGESRKSLALYYYYTTEYPYRDDLSPHSTIFIPS